MRWFKPEKIKKIGVWGFAFFLAKGLVWLAMAVYAYITIG
jgi:hypothetical protein